MKMTILHEIAESRKEDLDRIRVVIREFGNQDATGRVRKNLSEKLISQNRIGIIAELKPGSPSKGKLLDGISCVQDFNNPMEPTINDIEKKINAMIGGGALAISVLTEPRRFQASYGNLMHASKLTPYNIPILLKDFIIEDSQLELGKLCGASNALLISSICDPVPMAEKMIEIGLEPLVEIHDEADLRRIAPLRNADLSFVIGINNRNLRDLTTSFNPTHEMVPKIREIFGMDQPIITESGVFTRGDMVELGRTGVKAALVGTSLMQSSISDKLYELLGKRTPFVKICGITKDTALDVFDNRILDAIGFVVDVDSSPRNLTRNDAVGLVEATPRKLLRTLVTKGKSAGEIKKLDSVVRPDLIQNHVKDMEPYVKTLPNNLLVKSIIPIRVNDLGLEIPIEMIRKLPKSIFGVLLDSSEGKGKGLDQEMTKKIIESCPSRRIIIAGGISTENVMNIYRNIRPFGLDASTSLESMAGIKDPKKIAKFIDEIRKIREIQKKRLKTKQEMV